MIMIVKTPESQKGAPEAEKKEQRGGEGGEGKGKR